MHEGSVGKPLKLAHAADAPMPGVKSTETMLPKVPKSSKESGVVEVNVVILGFETVNSGVPKPRPIPTNRRVFETPVSRLINLKWTPCTPAPIFPAETESVGDIAHIVLLALGSHVSILGSQNCLIGGSVELTGGTTVELSIGGTMVELSAGGSQVVTVGSHAGGSAGGSHVVTVGSHAGGSAGGSHVVTVGSHAGGSAGGSHVVTVGSHAGGSAGGSHVVTVGSHAGGSAGGSHVVTVGSHAGGSAGGSHVVTVGSHAGGSAGGSHVVTVGSHAGGSAGGSHVVTVGSHASP